MQFRIYQMESIIMDNVLSGAGQPVIINHDRGGHGKECCSADLILSGHIHDSTHHTEDCVRGHGFNTDGTIQRFGLKTLDELCDVRRELSEVKCELNVRILEDGAKTRDLIRDQETQRLRDQVSFLQNQLIGIPVASR